MVNWVFFPRSAAPPPVAHKLLEAFKECLPSFASDKHSLESNAVLACMAPSLAAIGFQVEAGKKKAGKVSVPVLFGRNGKIEKAFEADAYHRDAQFVLEVEAGRGVVNNQFLKDLFQACMMQGVDYLGIAVRNSYRGADDFDKVYRFFDTLYTSDRLRLPLKGLLLIGY